MSNEGEMLDQLNVLDPPIRHLTFGGTGYAVSPLEFGRLPAFAREAFPVIQYLTSAYPKELAYIANRTEEQPEIPYATLMMMFMDLMGSRGDHLIDAVAVATGIPEDTLRMSTAYDELLEAVFAVVTVNVDFFARAVGPTLKLAVLRLAAKAVGIVIPGLGAGSTPSTS